MIFLNLEILKLKRHRKNLKKIKEKINITLKSNKIYFNKKK
jgi:hypothetical protein